jgi:hypothetical protein
MRMGESGFLRSLLGADQADHFARHRVAARRLLREDRLAVECDLEHSSRRPDHLDLDAGELLLQLSRQTGGSWLVVSDHAELDADLHRAAFR